MAFEGRRVDTNLEEIADGIDRRHFCKVFLGAGAALLLGLSTAGCLEPPKQNSGTNSNTDPTKTRAPFPLFYIRFQLGSDHSYNVYDDEGNGDRLLVIRDEFTVGAVESFNPEKITIDVLNAQGEKFRLSNSSATKYAGSPYYYTITSFNNRSDAYSKPYKVIVALESASRATTIEINTAPARFGSFDKLTLSNNGDKLLFEGVINNNSAKTKDFLWGYKLFDGSTIIEQKQKIKASSPDDVGRLSGLSDTKLNPKKIYALQMQCDWNATDVEGQDGAASGNIKLPFILEELVEPQ